MYLHLPFKMTYFVTLLCILRAFFSVFRKMPNGCRPCTEIAPWRPPNPSSTGSSIWFDTVRKPTSGPRRPTRRGLAISCWTCVPHWWRRYWYYGSSRAPSCTWGSTNPFHPMWNDAQSYEFMCAMAWVRG